MANKETFQNVINEDYVRRLTKQIKEETFTIENCEKRKELLEEDIKQLEMKIYYQGLKIASLKERYQNLIESQQND